MAKSKAVSALEAHVIALEAKLDLARVTYRAQKARIAELEGLLATRGHIATKPVVAQPTVTRFTKRDGSLWESTRLGNRTVSRAIESIA